jgi:hypothetical protein
VEAAKSLSDSWPAVQGAYDLTAFGPNGFLRAFRGSVSSTGKANLRVESRYDVDDRTVVLTITNLGKATVRFTVDNAYGKHDSITRQLRPGQSDRQRAGSSRRASAGTTSRSSPTRIPAFCAGSPVISKTARTV